MAWTISVTLDDSFDWINRQQMFIFKYALTSDASGSGDIRLSQQLLATYGGELGRMYMNKIKGGTLHCVKYLPDATNTPTSASTILIDDETYQSGSNVQGLIFNEAVSTAGTSQQWSGAIDTGFNPPFTELWLSASTLANAKVCALYLWILK